MFNLFGFQAKLFIKLNSLYKISYFKGSILYCKYLFMNLE